jgi:hypothetical protein
MRRSPHFQELAAPHPRTDTVNTAFIGFSATGNTWCRAATTNRPATPFAIAATVADGLAPRWPYSWFDRFCGLNGLDAGQLGWAYLNMPLQFAPTSATQVPLDSCVSDSRKIGR